jgi:hypothetical protein
MIQTAKDIQGHQQGDVNVFFCAHNMARADYPVIQKALLDDKRIILTGQCASGMAKISYTYQIEKKLTVTFIDSMNHMKCSLDTFGKNMGLKIEKQHCDHSVIKIDNYKTEIERQQIDYYLEMDCRVLYDGLQVYREQIREEHGVDIILESLLTSASLAQAVYFKNYYVKDQLYSMPEHMAAKCKKAYFGGLNEVFKRGTFTRVVALDVNSAHPASMIGNLPVNKSYERTFNELYVGQPLHFGIYRIIVISTPRHLKYPLLCDLVDGRLAFRHFQKYEMSVTHEDLEYAHKLGYNIHILDAIVCEQVGQPYTKYITEMYDARRKLKALMKQYRDTDDEYIRCNILQEV